MARTNSPQVKKETFIKKYTSCRWVVAYMTFTVITLMITHRQGMSMAIVCMAENTLTLNQTNNTLLFNETQREDTNNKWDSEKEGLLLSAFFYGFFITPALGGYLSVKFGAKNVVTSMIIITSFCSILIPYMSTVNVYIVFVLRLLTGCAYGCIQPSVAQLNAGWAPTSERAQIVAFGISGLNFGNIVTYLLSGFICTIPIQGGWPFIFYIFGAVSLLFLIPWLFCVYDYPMNHPRIDQEELKYIFSNRDGKFSGMKSVPWFSIFTSLPFWGLLTAHVAHGFIFVSLTSYLPIYMNDVLKYDISMNGLLSSLPFVGLFIGAIVSGQIADKLLVKGWLSVTNVRKLFQSIGYIGSSVFLIVASFLDKSNKELAFVLIFIYFTLFSAINSAFWVNHLDIAPRFAGIINGVTTMIASGASIVAPLVTSPLTVNGTREEWQIVFFINAGIGTLGALTFALIGSGEEQQWAKDNSETKTAQRNTGTENLGYTENENADDKNMTVYDQIQYIGKRNKYEFEADYITTSDQNNHIANNCENAQNSMKVILEITKF